MPLNSNSTPVSSADDWGPLSGLPGNPLMWILIVSELVAFGAILIGFSAARIAEPEVFAASQDQLNRVAGAINTLVLLTSGFFAALAVHHQHNNNTLKTRLWLASASLLGVVFLVVKFAEYGDKISVGISTNTNSFFMIYFLATGFHAAHVVFGIVILAIVAWKNSAENVATGTAFWHMVDLIWILLFPVVYLMR